MALTDCRECGGHVSKKADACPHCGVKNPGKESAGRAFIIVALGLFFVTCFAMIGDGEAEGEVSRDELGAEWPLSVERGRLACDRDAVTFTADGETWALNGVAQTRGFPEIDPIWLDHPSPNIPKKSIAPLIERGLELCE